MDEKIKIIKIREEKWKSGRFPVAGFEWFGEHVEKWSISGGGVWRF